MLRGVVRTRLLLIELLRVWQTWALYALAVYAWRLRCAFGECWTRISSSDSQSHTGRVRSLWFVMVVRYFVQHSLDDAP